jgi:hypothetical protein
VLGPRVGGGWPKSCQRLSRESNSEKEPDRIHPFPLDHLLPNRKKNAMSWMKPKSYPFSQFSILLYAPPQPAVYGLHTLDRWIYVGETENLRETLQGYFKGDRPSITSWEPSGFCFESCPEASRTQRKNQLVSELRPLITNCHDSAELCADRGARQPGSHNVLCACSLGGAR